VIVEPRLKETETDSNMAYWADRGVRKGAGPLESSGDRGQSLFDIVMARDPKALALRSVWY
jgi:hypothetical protein